ncbi:MAG: DNA-binding response regulator [Firmicutes bacterium HGW-Firmicutes-14]|nr:MAG: DNA-binding response regulator [Firmicutes bacterium HGW-Firmicutes-14]
MTLKILLVDDEELFVKGLARSLANEGYETVAAYDGESARTRFKSENVDLVILDIMLPEVDGLTLCREFRSVSEVPIIMLTARGDDIDKIIGLEMGADDYLAKPFNMRELLARIKAVLRRLKREKNVSAKQISRRGMEIDTDKHRVTVNGGEIELTGKEYELLAHMAGSPGRIFTREKLLEDIWGYDYIGEDRTVDVHIRRLREKVEPEPGKPRYIMTKWGVGYYFNDEE